jgi:hypothetical protein
METCSDQLLLVKSSGSPSYLLVTILLHRSLSDLVQTLLRYQIVRSVITDIHLSLRTKRVVVVRHGFYHTSLLLPLGPWIPKASMRGQERGSELPLPWSVPHLVDPWALKQTHASFMPQPHETFNKRH